MGGELAGLQASLEQAHTAPVITFAGQQFSTAAGTHLVILLQLAGALARPSEPSDTSEPLALASIYRALATLVAPQDWDRFEQAAFAAKTSFDDVMGALQQAVSHVCARPYFPAIRLLGWVAANLGEVEGKLLAHTGRDLGSLTPRQVCNLAFAWLIDGKDEDQRSDFIGDLNATGDPEREALEAALAHSAAMRKRMENIS